MIEGRKVAENGPTLPVAAIPLGVLPMSTLHHRTVVANGINIHFAEQGSGPLVVLCHGFPEGWYSWRHQLPALAAAGYRVVAPDQRGYGRTDHPERIEDYDIFRLTGDIVGLVQALGEDRAVVVGHDWGAPVAWHWPCSARTSFAPCRS